MTALANEEQDRLDAHFEWVLTILRAQPVDSWPEARRRAREATLEQLGQYAAAGRFPRNVTHLDRMAPAFVDADGTACAVAHLLLSSDGSGLARDIERKHNLAYVAEMPAAALARWADDAGLTMAEVALIQPDYCPDPGPCWTRVTCGPPPCECPVATKLPDGTECGPYPLGSHECAPGFCEGGDCVYLDHPCDDGDANTQDTCDAGVCTNAAPVVAEPSAPVTTTDEGGCGVGAGSTPDWSTGSVAPLLAAVFLLALAARRSRARRRVHAHPVHRAELVTSDRPAHGRTPLALPPPSPAARPPAVREAVFRDEG